MDSSVYNQTRRLVTKLAVQCSTQDGFGTMSPSLYNTAWLSMIKKPSIAGSVDWLFPECFRFLLRHQLPSGAWESYASPVDGILNTAAGLLALSKHSREFPTSPEDLPERIKKAEKSLGMMLSSWDLRSTDHVGFELLVVQMLSLLRDEAGITISPPYLKTLTDIREKKLQKLSHLSVYEEPSTLYHSLEALIGYVDFNKLRSLRDANGSMMGSPSSTAAYLMYSSNWDHEAEVYLRKVVKDSVGQGSGGVPCAWPTTIFEVTWVVTTLAAGGFEFDLAEARLIADCLEQALKNQAGILGFFPGCVPDADDTAKAISSMSILGRAFPVDRLIAKFETEDHFKTYFGERNASFSANCNVLTCLLRQNNPQIYMAQIAKAVKFLTRQLLQGRVNEKWHLKDMYWIMVLLESFELVTKDMDMFEHLCRIHPHLSNEVPLISLHLMMRILSEQKYTGSWEESCELTSYAILSLSSLSHLPWLRDLDMAGIISAMAQGKSFLLSKRSEWSKGEYLWIEKLTYASNILSEAYCLAAAMVVIPSFEGLPLHRTCSFAWDLPIETTMGMKKATALIRSTPLFKTVNPYVMRAVEIQAGYALRMLQQSPCFDVFPRIAKGEMKSLYIIPLAFIASTAVQVSSVSLPVIVAMVELSALNFLIDEYMEGVIENQLIGELPVVRELVRETIGNATKALSYNGSSGHSNGNIASNVANSSHNGTPSHLIDMKVVLVYFVNHILHHPAVLGSSRYVQRRLASEVETFLLAHITHAEDSRDFNLQEKSEHKNGVDDLGHINLATPLKYAKPRQTFYGWVRSTSADNTSCPFSFVFYNCLVREYGKPGAMDIFASVRTAYVAEDLCRHLASLCRMYNDYGSITRDREEGNLNSVNFPEFHGHTAELKLNKDSPEGFKSTLLWVAEYERRGLNSALETLETNPENQAVVNELKLFINVTDLYGHIYAIKDVGTRTK